MKKYILLLFIVCLQLLPAKAQWVTIPDANFVTKLQQLYPSCMNGNLMDTTCLDILNAGVLYLDYGSISDLTGLQYFVNLQILYCRNNQLTTLPVLSEKLTYLDCSNNQISSIPSLSDSLNTFICSNNYLTGLPSLPNNLKVLKCNQNDLASIPSLPNSLLSLTCSHQGGQLSALPPLPVSLLYLDCGYNYSISIPPLLLT
jgi:Leucine-rich repeat (LRR) protein